MKDDDDEVVLLCSGCEDNISSDSVFYKCNDASNQCDFNLHKSCFELPREIRHKSHLEHTLTLLAKPHSSSSSNHKDGKFACNACLQDGADFVYNCSICEFDLHIEYASLPESIKRTDHKHPLNLFYSNPAAAVQQNDDQNKEVKMMSFVCDVSKCCWRDGLDLLLSRMWFRYASWMCGLWSSTCSSSCRKNRRRIDSGNWNEACCSSTLAEWWTLTCCCCWSKRNRKRDNIIEVMY